MNFSPAILISLALGFVGGGLFISLITLIFKKRLIGGDVPMATKKIVKPGTKTEKAKPSTIPRSGGGKKVKAWK